MASFLCPNTSSVRSYRYFGIFEDINNLNQYDWCGYIPDWLLDCVKSFNHGKSISSGFGGSLGGCLYYLAVLYLDYVDFGVRQVLDSIPRITIWKDSMIQTYAQLDMKSPGSYGYHPLLDVSHTFYSKDLRFLYNPMCVNIDSHFAENLDQFSGRKLPDSLKASICKLIQNYLFNSWNLLKSMFCKLLNHVYSIDSRIENLVLDLLKLIANAYKNNDRGSNHENATSTQHPNVHEVDEEMNSSGSSRRQNLGNSDAQDDVPGSQYEAERATNPSSHIPCANLAQVDNDVIARVMQNLTKNTHFCHNEIKKSDAGPSKIRLDKAKNSSPFVHAKEPVVSAPKKLKHSAIYNANHHTQSDVIMLDKENYYAPDSISPSPKPGMTRFFSKQTPIVMQTIGCTPHSTQRKSSAVSQCLRNSSSIFNSRLTENHSDSPEVKIVGERSLDDSKSSFKGSAPQALCPAPSARFDVNDSQSFSFRARDSTSGGKCHVHGPRRVVKPGPLFKGGCVTGSNTNKFHVSKSEIDNYNSIVKLALSEFQGEDAVNLSRVRCTFWALGDSLKPGGVVKFFVVSVFAYSLFSKPSGHPDQLLKDVDEADQDVLARAFRRSSKARLLNQSNMLFYPTFFQDHWFVFVADIKDRMYVILDSVFKKDDEYKVFVRGRLRNSFQIHWDKYVGLDMGFENYEFVYPAVPEQPPENTTDSGIYCMMFLEH
ncbi:hypothetical protein PVAP13_7KG237555 [Panicum virgatum]|uniref:Ubiquitin-like protease family profile domain-containing protein n=1 Tax=Panicum virgatum TaxID=38727 RepID=A0A8T0QKW8_PANVG|nr:hypothetical protein PVAP13_7KG237555 [Panicum virgatum]